MSKNPRKIIYTVLVIFNTFIISLAFLVFTNNYVPVQTKAEVSDIVQKLVKTEPIVSKNIHILFVGDMMFDRAVRKTVNSKGYDFVFGDSKYLFETPDLVVGNLEGSITNFSSRTLQKDGKTGEAPLDFTFATGTAMALKSIGVDVVSLANNHSLNRGQEGLRQTKFYLKEAGVDFFGDPENLSGQSIVRCMEDFCVGLVGYHEFAYKNEENVISDIQELKNKVNMVIVMPHWGIEYQKTPTKLQRSLAHKWIDAGADIIIGAHPHIIESIEEYNGHKIFYSLGNFIFDQYFSFDTTHGLAVDISIDQKNKGLGFKLIPIENKNTIMTFPNATTTNFILNDLANSSKKYVSTTTLENILKGQI